MSELHIHMHFNEGPITRELPAVDPDMPAHAKPKTYTVGQVHDAVLATLSANGYTQKASLSLANEVLKFLAELK